MAGGKVERVAVDRVRNMRVGAMFEQRLHDLGV